MTALPAAAVVFGQNVLLTAAGLRWVQRFVRLAVKPESARGWRPTRKGGEADPTPNARTTPRLPLSNPSPGPPGISSAKNNDTKTVSSVSIGSPLLVMAMASGLPLTSWTRRIVRSCGEISKSLPVKSAT
jgi:hypothetical protein